MVADIKTSLFYLFFGVIALFPGAEKCRESHSHLAQNEKQERERGREFDRDQKRTDAENE